MQPPTAASAGETVPVEEIFKGCKNNTKLKLELILYSTIDRLVHCSRNAHGDAKSPLFVVYDKTFPHETVDDVRRLGGHPRYYVARKV